MRSEIGSDVAESRLGRVQLWRSPEKQNRRRWSAPERGVGWYRAAGWGHGQACAGACELAFSARGYQACIVRNAQQKAAGADLMPYRIGQNS